MPVFLIAAFAASLGLHALALFGPEVELPSLGESPQIVAEVKAPPPAEVAQPERAAATPRPSVKRSEARSAAAKGAQRRPASAPEAPAAEPAGPDSSNGVAVADSAAEAGAEGPAAAYAAEAASPLDAPVPTESSLPSRGTIHYRVERGDQGFQIGRSVHEWEIVDGAYRITAVSETSGLVGFFKPLRVEVESRGRLTVAGLVPQRFETRQEGRENNEQADFDWRQMELRMGNRPVQALSPGSQDLLSYPYQLGLLGHLAPGSSIPIATGKKYAAYQVEVVGDEDIEVPAGTFRSLHLRVPGVAKTDLWLAYDHAMLPVRIQYLDRKGALYVQVATAIDVAEAK
ncbi:DUF3108 domain-containing protein [Accumulibacter sp.]|uniref:DUF3108 domain-containing protein n=1 Tax=Accumulibacter sp. TaxID=2053492 RepID=UPI0025EE280B|nr:DUF3108 domain-containing protein [Accumulibacter sp.]MCM8596448.1 DUF3108 domain-containing protein [Accumulibacter sp.]MCM8627076.1 DUF3108 domain-containing protein [Accumulibacter sp.]MDS4050597.1 DUF3108 domain-containing protein [Accumulibacter sp.]